jgi:hypothetical protein
MTTIEILYFDGCPSWTHAWAGVGLALAETGIEATVRLRNIEALPPSELAGFAGSPTVRIDGLDVEAYDGPPVVACRRYEENEGRGWPSSALLHERLSAATRVLTA